MKVGVIGLGTGGITFISEIRRLRVPCEIFLFEKRGLKVFHPCSIPEALEGKIELQSLIEPFGLSGITFMGQAREVDPYSLSVGFENNGSIGRVSLDFVFVATGGDVVLPSKNFFKATKYDDVERIKQLLPGAKRIGIVGAGILGLELASALSVYPIQIEIFEAKDHILPELIDRGLSEKLLKKIDRKNVFFNFGRFVNDISGFDIVIFCTGFKPVSPLPFEIRVDEYMRVIDPRSGKPFDRIFAAGDCITYDFKIPRVATIAAEQARIAARNIKMIVQGNQPEEKYELFVAPVLVKAFSYEVGKVGRIHKPSDLQKFYLDLKVLPFDERKIHIYAELDKNGIIYELQAFCDLRSEVRHIIDISYISMKKMISVSDIRRFELSYQPEVCKFPDPVTSFAEFVSRRLGIL